MGPRSKIAWCTHTFNPWWGCTQCSPGCEHCYAEAWARRTGQADCFGPEGTRFLFGPTHWDQVRRWNDAASRSPLPVRVFCGSMCDVFEHRAELEEPRARLLQLIAQTPNLVWLLLTKRPGNMRPMTRGIWPTRWPNHVWALTTVEYQAHVRRIDELLRVPAAVHGVSCEPLLGQIDLQLGCIRCQHYTDAECPGTGGPCVKRPLLRWLIIGAESGPQRRPCRQAWVESLVKQARSSGAAVFVKQLALPSGKISKDPAEWPEHLRIQEWPKLWYRSGPSYGKRGTSPLVDRRTGNRPCGGIERWTLGEDRM